MNFYFSLISKEGIISIVFTIIISLMLKSLLKNKGLENTFNIKSIFIITLGSILYGIISLIGLPVSPNTYFRISIALLTIIGTLFGPLIGFLVGVIGHVINDLIVWGSVWWSWVFISGILGLFAGLINLCPDFNIKSGHIKSTHIIKMYLLSVISILVAGFIAFLGDIMLYNLPASIVWIEIIIVSISNFIVIALLGVPLILLITKGYKDKPNL
ncbi:ECF-type riboflavin transporter substrate-binding protein [Clostridium sediminicola]|uniref:ECF-type riboflavin transporter substrate-binding protein n=1 Tax=Clostridium sediminicola TaxID=3114879 RepID=UPI0031F25D21